MVSFTDLITKYIPEYSDRYSVSKVFVDKNKVNFDLLSRMYDESRPYEALYLLFYGNNGLNGAGVDYWDSKKSEEVYKKALDTGKTWEEVIGFKGFKRGELY